MSGKLAKNWLISLIYVYACDCLRKMHLRNFLRRLMQATKYGERSHTHRKPAYRAWCGLNDFTTDGFTCGSTNYICEDCDKPSLV
jgi:hypothetical protein